MKLDEVASLPNFVTWTIEMERWHKFSFKGTDTAIERVDPLEVLRCTDGRFTARLREPEGARYLRSSGQPVKVQWDFMFEDETDAIAFKMWYLGAIK